MKKIKATLLLLPIILLFFFTQAWATGVGHPARTADLRLLETIIGDEDWVLVDCRTRKAYDDGHIPMSITFGDTCARVLLGADGKPRPVAELEKILGSNGISAEKNVIFYADGPSIPQAITAVWVMGYLGHERVQFFNVDAWVAGGLPMVKSRLVLDPVEYKAVRR
jgi:3-mercaptopyruvate sulfurtransferase SseA